MARRIQKPELITGLDIGSTGIRAAVGQYISGNDLGSELQIIATAEVASEGIHKGTITSIEEAVSSIAHVLEEIDRLVGVPIDNAWVGISGTQIKSQENRGVVAVAKTDGEISQEDVLRVIDSTQTIAAPLNYEVLHVLPKYFSVDGQTGIKDPVGMTGVRLEADAQMIYGSTPHIKNITKAIYRTGIEIDDLVLSVVAAADVVLTQKQKDLGVALVDIGGSTTTLSVYEEGNLLYTAIVPIGSNHITNDIALGLQTSIDVAEKIKVAYGSCIIKGITRRDSINLSEFGEPDQVVSQRFVVEIIAARVVEILEKLEEELVKADRQAMLPAGVVFIGGGSRIRGLVELAKNVLHMNASYGFAKGINSTTDIINDLSYITAVGLVRWGAYVQEKALSQPGFLIPGGKKAAAHMKKLFRFLVP